MNKRYYEHTLSTTREFIEYLRKTYLIKILNNLTLAKKYFQKNAGK